MDLLVSNSKDALFINQLNVLNAAMSQAQQELASGKRILNASDDPASVPAIVQNQADLARVEQSQSNLNTLNSEVGMASGDLESAATIMDNISSLAAEGATGTTSAQTRQVLAGQIQDLETQMVGIANSTNEGRYLFGGDNDATAPYSINYANNCNIDNDVTVLPEPDSPTIATVSPLLILKEIFFTAEVLSEPVTKSILKFFIWRRGSFIKRNYRQRFNFSAHIIQ